MSSVRGCCYGCLWRLHAGDFAEEAAVEDLDVETDGAIAFPYGGRIYGFKYT